MRVKATEADILEDVNGGCIECGEIQYGGVEPDARKYECECCGKNAVYGLAELCIMGMIDLETDDED